jgi:hypothetical protein
MVAISFENGVSLAGVLRAAVGLFRRLSMAAGKPLEGASALL